MTEQRQLDLTEWPPKITPDDAPRTLIEAVERDIRAAMFDSAITLAIETTGADTPARHRAVDAANQRFDHDVTDTATRLVDYLGEHFVPGLTGSAPRLNDERPAAVPAPVLSGQPLLDIFVAGTPAPQGSKTGRPIYSGRGDSREFTGKVAMTESSKKVKPWRTAVRAAAELAWAGRAPLDEALALRVEFVLYRPVATPKRTTPPATKYPDVSKLTRSTEDALTQAGVLRDDARIVDEWPSKRLAEIGEQTGARIRIWAAKDRPWGVPPGPMTPEPQLLLPQVALVFAFRYALGRRTTAVPTVADELIHQAPRLEQWQREQIVRDIDRAISSGQAGADCDIEVWRKVRDLFAEINQRPPEVSRG